MSAAECPAYGRASEAASAVTTRVETRGVKFEPRQRALLKRIREWTFAFPSGNGEAMGLE